MKNTSILNEDTYKKGSVLIENDTIMKIIWGELKEDIIADQIIDAGAKILMPGVVDDQDHFIEPDLHRKLSKNDLSLIVNSINGFNN